MVSWQEGASVDMSTWSVEIVTRAGGMLVDFRCRRARNRLAVTKKRFLRLPFLTGTGPAESATRSEAARPHQSRGRIKRENDEKANQM